MHCHFYLPRFHWRKHIDIFWYLLNFFLTAPHLFSLFAFLHLTCYFFPVAFWLSFSLSMSILINGLQAYKQNMYRISVARKGQFFFNFLFSPKDSIGFPDLFTWRVWDFELRIPFLYLTYELILLFFPSDSCFASCSHVYTSTKRKK